MSSSKSSGAHVATLKKTLTRTHPYMSQPQQQTPQSVVSSTSGKMTRKQSTNVQHRQNVDTYELQDYLGGDLSLAHLTGNASEYPTIRRATASGSYASASSAGVAGPTFKGILKNRANAAETSAKTASKAATSGGKSKTSNAPCDLEDPKMRERLKFLSGNTKSIEYFAHQFERVADMQRNAPPPGRKGFANGKVAPPALIGNYLFEIIGEIKTKNRRETTKKIIFFVFFFISKKAI